MKKNLIYIVIIVVVVVLFAGSFRRGDNIRNYPSSGANIIAFGDSLVVGLGASKGNDFISLLSDELDEPIKNLGRSGDTTVKALLRLDEVLESDPKIVLLLLGGNDYLRRIPKKKTLSNLKIMIEAIQNKGSIVVLLGVRGGILKDNYKADFKKLSIEHKTAYVPNILDGLIGHKGLMFDAIHPNDEGYKIIADKVYLVIKDLI